MINDRLSSTTTLTSTERDIMNLFEIATREKFRFASIKGELSVEQLWDVSLTSKTGFDLDTIARTVNQESKETDTESFVQTTVS
ncbi:MAG: hypothetical protein ACMV1B_10780, partial [Prevotella sp.]